MSDEELRIETEKERERAHAARYLGGTCAVCGRRLGINEPVYLERLRVAGSYLWAPVGAECASQGMLEGVAGTPPGRCPACGRDVYRHPGAPKRQSPTCSRRCRAQAATARRQAAESQAG
jgi:hypothetical protein